MTDLLAPDVSQATSRVLQAALRGKFAYVEGPVGSGRTALVDALRDVEHAVVVELLPLQEPDAPAVTFVEVSANLPPADRPVRRSGTEVELHGAGKLLSERLRAHGKFLVLRVPESWQVIENSLANDDVVPARAAALLHGIFAGGATTVLVSDAAVTAERLGFHPELRILLPSHAVRVDSLSGETWGSYQAAFDTLLHLVPPAQLASPLAWRLAVGAIALDAPTESILAALSLSTPIYPLARILSTSLRQQPELGAAVARFLAVRRPLAVTAVEDVSQIGVRHAPLLTMCLGYGTPTVHVAPMVRRVLRARLTSFAEELKMTHLALAAHYAVADGAPSPAQISAAKALAWCEKVHHLAHADELGVADWEHQEFPSPEFFWDRARRLSIVHQDHALAAAVYRKCTVAFPEDDYAWHYLAFNLQRSQGPRGEIESAFRKAVAIAPENAWWNSRLITFLIADGRPGASYREWLEAMARVDPDGTQVRAGPWLSRNLHRWVCREWLRSGRTSWARSVLRLVPTRFLRQGGWKHLDRQAQDGSAEWARFLGSLDDRFAAAHYVRSWWRQLSLAASDKLPLPMADLTADGERFQFTWSYRAVLLEVEIASDGGLNWFAKDRLTDAVAGGEGPAGKLGTDLAEWLRRVVDA